jgi:integrase/recombinase XerD
MVVATIVRWYKDDLNVDSYIPILSTYLGHSHPSYTYWYLTGTPELLGVVLSRLKKYQ